VTYKIVNKILSLKWHYGNRTTVHEHNLNAEALTIPETLCYKFYPYLTYDCTLFNSFNSTTKQNEELLPPGSPLQKHLMNFPG